MLDYYEELFERYNCLESIKDEILLACVLIRDALEDGTKLLVAGNGGSAADSEHIVGELLKSFDVERPIDDELKDRLKKVDPERGAYLSIKLEKALPAISLTSHPSFASAYANDVNSTLVFAQQLMALGRSGDVFLGISTSGNSENIIDAAVTAKALGIKVVALTGNDGGELVKYADRSVIVPEKETYKIQELHIPIYHMWCHMIEEYFFSVD